MVSPHGRRRAVESLRTQHYSERRACRLVGQPRSTQRNVRTDRAISRSGFESVFFISHGSTRGMVIAGSRPKCVAKDGS
jgi:hypothetical protein